MVPVLTSYPPSQILSVQSTAVTDMSSRRSNAEGLDQVVRRPKAEVLEEMAALASLDKARMTAPIAPAPRPPGRFWIDRRPPPRPPINPFIPVSPERPLDASVAAVRAQARKEEEKASLEREEELRAWAYEHAARPRTPSPPREAEDHYDLARWNRQRWI